MWNLEFSRPVFLWLLVLLPMLIGAHFFFLKRTQEKALKFANFLTLKRVSGERLVTKNITILVLRSIVIFCFIVSLAGSTLWYSGQRSDFDYVIAIDTSSSMTATDLLPTRLESAKSSATSFLDSFDSKTNVGLVSFSGVTYVLNPLTDDFVSLGLKINSLNISRIAGTDLSGAIITSTNLFSKDELDVGKSVIILTDGSDTVGAYLADNLREASNYALEHHVVVDVIGLGKEDTLVGYLPEEFNLTVGINTNAIELITNITGGTAVYVNSNDDLENYFSDLSLKSHEARIPFDLAFYSFIFGFLLLMIEWILINLTFRRIV